MSIGRRFTQMNARSEMNFAANHANKTNLQNPAKENPVANFDSRRFAFIRGQQKGGALGAANSS
jgi:hypothetical protein